MTRLYQNGSKRTHKIFGVLMSAAIGLLSLSTPSYSAPVQALKAPTNKPAVAHQNPAPVYTPDVLLVMPNASSEKDDIIDTVKDANGTIVAQFGEGKMKVMVIKTAKGKLEETEKKFTKDKKHFAVIGRNYKVKMSVVPNDPEFAASWHLPALNCPRAWDRSRGSVKIAVMDTGCQASVADLSGKTEKGYDAYTVASHIFGAIGGFLPPGLSDLGGAIAGALSSGANTDKHGHGTWVACSAAATMNNSTMGAGVAPGATVYPIRIANADPGGSAMADDLSLIAAMTNVFTSGARIVNISYGAPYVGFHNPLLHPVLHKMFAEYYFLRGGLIFMSAGNDGWFDAVPGVPYINMVSAIDQSGTLADFGGGKGSNYGPFVDFTAPGTAIIVTDIDGSKKSVQGTSFSSPIVAAEAALVWNRNPALPNFMVENILKASCINLTGNPFNMYYGWGMPDAARAVQLAGGN